MTYKDDLLSPTEDPGQPYFAFNTTWGAVDKEYILFDLYDIDGKQTRSLLTGIALRLRSHLHLLEIQVHSWLSV